MFDIIFPETLSPTQLDEYLSRGYYRMGQSVFTDSIIVMANNMYKVYWLRICLEKMQENKKTKKLFRKNADLRVELKPFYLSNELVALYDLYRASIDFDAPDDLPHYFLEEGITSIFNTNIIEIRDGEKLVAAGFYDIGENSTAAIMNFYHPDYKQRGLGIYLFFLEIAQSRKENKKWLYPGYVADGNSKFDYKLLPGVEATEMYDADREMWVPFRTP